MTDLGKLRRNGRAGADPAITVRPRHEPRPGSEDDFMTRVQLALDLTPKQLANVLGVPLSDVVDRTGPRSAMSSSVTDPFWKLLQRHVDNSLAGLLALKDELDRKIRLDLREHAVRLSRVINRG
jgi:hypothetical protein